MAPAAPAMQRIAMVADSEDPSSVLNLSEAEGLVESRSRGRGLAIEARGSQACQRPSPSEWGVSPVPQPRSMTTEARAALGDDRLGHCRWPGCIERVPTGAGYRERRSRPRLTTTSRVGRAPWTRRATRPRGASQSGRASGPPSGERHAASWPRCRRRARGPLAGRARGRSGSPLPPPFHPLCRRP